MLCIWYLVVAGIYTDLAHRYITQATPLKRGRINCFYEVMIHLSSWVIRVDTMTYLQLESRHHPDLGVGECVVKPGFTGNRIECT